MLDATQRNSVIFSAYAKLPAGITAYEVHKVIGVVVEIDMQFCRRNVLWQPSWPVIL